MNKPLLSFLEIINLSTEFLRKKGVPSPKCDVEWIVSFITKKKRVELYLEFENPVDQKYQNKIREFVIERGKRIPLQHILGKVNFAGVELYCDNRALIPRPETEYLTELINERIGKILNGKILDLGTGSGAILITLCMTNKLWDGTGLDKSSNAIDLANQNASFHKLENVHFKKFDWDNQKLENIYDIIVSNPPYLSIEEWKEAESEVRLYDPKIALVSTGGTADLIKIIEHAKTNLRKDGMIALETGLGHKNTLIPRMENYFYDIEVIKDFSSRERFIIARKK